MSKTCTLDSQFDAVSTPQIAANEPISSPGLCIENFRSWLAFRERFDDWEGSWQLFGRLTTLKQLGRSPSASTEQHGACYSPPGARGAQVILFLPRELWTDPGRCDEKMRVLIGGRSPQ
jgi:hypothetical protein